MSALNAEGKPAEAWRFVADDEAIGDSAEAIVVSQARFLKERESLLERNGRVGVRVAPATDKVEDIAADAPRLALIEVLFPAYRDGRGYSAARLLRDRYGFTGDLRAVGDVLEDQIFYMLRCGFTSFEIKSLDAEASLLRSAKT
ncbi:MAG: DUF934 domain-containing protein, partial [Hyphomonadaceae bacterium]